MDDLEARIARIEDRTAVSETVINYGLQVDRRDWAAFTELFTDPVVTDYENGVATGSTPRADLMATIAEALDGFGHTQHLSTNHVVTFDDDDADVAVCISQMYAQHELAGSVNGDFYLLRAIYTDHLRRTDDGWRIEGIETENRWEEGNLSAVTEAIQRTRGRGVSGGR